MWGLGTSFGSVLKTRHTKRTINFFPIGPSAPTMHLDRCGQLHRQQNSSSSANESEATCEQGRGWRMDELDVSVQCPFPRGTSCTVVSSSPRNTCTLFTHETETLRLPFTQSPTHLVPRSPKGHHSDLRPQLPSANTTAVATALEPLTIIDRRLLTPKRPSPMY